MINTSRTRATLVGAVLLAAAPVAYAVPVQFAGGETGFASTPGSDAAFASWSASAGAFTLDNLEGIDDPGNPANNPGFGGTVTSALGNTFSTSDDLLRTPTFGVGVIDGLNITLTQQGGLTDLVWDLAGPVSAFGFFTRNQDGGTLEISFMNGTTLVQASQAAFGPAGNGDNLFIGFTGLDGVTQVRITATDPGTGSTGKNSLYDRFVYSPAATDVPAPGALGLLLLAVGALSARRRGR